ncbi:helix-turn-helix transcriptional regulator [Amycolatopsis keratiniphila]|uniref:helix-turn-helix transcriptional regulator n=1 Tax=Amycolatopsis keratiniphila TaxID=129921 RepID=UPI0033CB2C49
MTDDRTERQWHETVLHLNAVLDRLGHRAGQLGLGEREAAALRELRTRIDRGYHLPDTTPDDLNDDVDRMVEYLRLLEQSSLGSPGAYAIRRRSNPKAVAAILARDVDALPFSPNTAGTDLAQAIVDALPPTAALGANDYVLLRTLAHQPGEVIPIETIAAAVWATRRPRAWRELLHESVDRLQPLLQDLRGTGQQASIAVTPEGFKLRPRIAGLLLGDLHQSLASGGDRGGLPMPPQRVPSPMEQANLSPAEREILAMFAEGKTAREIADHLHLALKTVKNYIERLKRMDVRSEGAAEPGNRLPRF